MRELTLGLALGAGGTKGAAHVGVMRVLDDAGIHPSVIAGTSIGSLYGGCYAVGRTSYEMEEGIRTCPRRDVVAFFQHRLKIRHNNRLARRFYEALAGHNIESLPIKYAATASDMVERRQVTIDRGPIIDAIEASIAIPLIARPVSHQGRYFLDGGFWDCAPVDAATALGADIVVAVQLGRPVTLPERLHRPAMWLAERMDRLPMKWTAAGLPFTIRAVTTPLVRGRSAQVVIHPPMQRFGGLSPMRMVDSLDAGIKAAEEALPTIRALLAGETPAEVAHEYMPAARMVIDPTGAA
jgi:NTE family protein